ncbi:MAG: MarR family transcriptional regulator [Bacteroidetes bacterium]|nr:MarR family transcriptional regulator [Bacteroidota bacterium]
MNGEQELKGNFQSESHKLVINIRLTSNAIGAVHTKYIAQFDLSMAQFNILRILRGAKEPLTINTVKDRMIEKSPNTTRLIDKLLEKTWVRKFQCKEDRRQTYLHITEKGLDLLGEIDKSEDFPSIKDLGITTEECILMNEMLEKVKEGYK